MTTMSDTALVDRDIELLERVAEVSELMRREVSRKIVGQHEVVDELLNALMANGHALLVGVPGLAKTLLIQTVAEALDLNFSRIQFTPDLMPTDITGTEVIEEDRTTGKRVFRFRERTYLREHRLGGRDQPDAAQDAGCPARGDAGAFSDRRRRHLPTEPPVLRARHAEPHRAGRHVPSSGSSTRQIHARAADLLSDEGRRGRDRHEDHGGGARGDPTGDHGGRTDRIAGTRPRRIPAPPSLVSFAVRLARSTRPGADAAKVCAKYAAWGAGPRASQYLVLGAKARAASRGSAIPSYDDVRAIAPAVLAHRVVLNFEAEADGRKTRDVIRELLEESQGWT